MFTGFAIGYKPSLQLKCTCSLNVIFDKIYYELERMPTGGFGGLTSRGKNNVTLELLATSLSS